LECFAFPFLCPVNLPTYVITNIALNVIVKQQSL
jgi:hypothetical protein